MEIAWDVQVLCCLVLASIQSSIGQFVTLETPSGSVKGVSANGVTRFQAIPYGEAPVDELRFKRPQKKELWQGVFDATNEGYVCIQFNPPPFAPPRSESEDCLSLDVYVPRDLSIASNSLESLPVLVHIHPGGFMSGSRLDNHGTRLAKKGNMIVVNINYRLGPLGFLALELDETPANVGLLDQKLALEWVANNIESFGGNPEKVTVYGASAGSVSISMQLLSPAFKGLFRSAILSSGVYYKNLKTKKEAAEATLMVSKYNACDDSTSKTILECLQELSVQGLKDSTSGIQYIPVVDGDLIPDQPPKLLKSGNFNHIPVMLGFNSDDGLISFARDRELMMWGVLQSDITSSIADRFRFSRIGLSQEQVEAAVELAKAYYFSNKTDRYSNLRSAIDAFRDIHFVAPILKLANAFSEENVPVYLYEYDEKVLTNSPRYSMSTGANHGDEMPFVFGRVFNQTAFPQDATPMKQKFSENLIKMWSDFVYNGKPTLRTGFLELEWEPYTEADPKYALLKAGASSIESNPAPRAAKVFNRMLDEVKQKIPCPNVGPSRLDLNPVVVTESGKIKGVRETGQRGVVTADTFYGIPYAAPPVKNLRFRRTQPVKPWKGTLDATEFGPACPQPDSWVRRSSEDCLTLNIWVPKGVNQAKKSPKPILFYIHGGSFVAGSNSDLNMIGLASYGDVMVVSVQYRLGILGFVSSGKSSMPGNLAAWDLLEALKWVRANAKYFGGDIDKITVGGHSAGGALSTLVLMSPRFKGLFSKVFAMSGSMLGSFALDRNPETRYNILLNEVGCNEQNTEEEKIKCLHEVPTSKFKDAAEKNLFLSFWNPNVDGVILPDAPYNMRPELSKVKYLGGTVLTEGLWIGGQPSEGMTYKDLVQFNLNSLYPNSPAVAEATLEFYNFDDPNNATEFGKLVRDGFFLAGCEGVASSVISQGGEAYVYVANFTTPERPNGARHGDELALFSGWPLMDIPGTNFTKEQKGLSRTWVAYFSNFITTGDPNDYYPVAVPWPAYDLEDRTHLVLQEPMTIDSIKYSHRVKYVDFFDKLVPMLTNQPDKCLADDDIIQIEPAFMTEDDDDERQHGRPVCRGDSGLFNASRKQIDAAVIGLIVVSAFLLILVIILVFTLYRKNAKSYPQSYELSNGKHGIDNGVSF